MRLGVFGGSFDPIHHGHLLVARALREALDLDEVRVIPAGGQPLKAGTHAASGAHRARMVELALEGEPGLVADQREILRPGPSYTVETLRSLATEQPQARLVLLLGGDAARDFAAWREPDRILELAEVVAFTRAGGPEAAGEGIPPALHRVTAPQCDLSATEIRARVRAGQSIRYLVPDRVADYIAAHGLYQGEAG